MPNKKRMKKLVIFLTESEYKQILDDSDKTGLSSSEIVRRMVDKDYSAKEVIADPGRIVETIIDKICACGGLRDGSDPIDTVRKLFPNLYIIRK
jgi:hypothetical protein